MYHHIKHYHAHLHARLNIFRRIIISNLPSTRIIIIIIITRRVLDKVFLSFSSTSSSSLLWTASLVRPNLSCVVPPPLSPSSSTSYLGTGAFRGVVERRTRPRCLLLLLLFFFMALLLVRQFSSGGLLDDIHCIKARGVVWGDEEANSNSSWYTTHSKEEEERERTKITTPTHQSANTSSCWSQTAPRFAGRRPWWRRRASRPRNRRIATECLWEKKMSFFSFFFFFEAKFCLPSSFLCSQY